MKLDKTAWFEELPEQDQEAICNEAVEYFAELVETGSASIELSNGKYVLSLTVVKEG